MIIEKGHPLFAKTTLLDIRGKIVPMVQRWDTTKEEALIILGGRPYDGGLFRCTITKDSNIVLMTASLPGCYLVYNDTKKRVPKEAMNVGR